MAIRSPLLVRGFVSPLQLIAAFVMVITGIFDRVLRVFGPSYIAMPIWTGLLVGFVVYINFNLHVQYLWAYGLYVTLETALHHVLVRLQVHTDEADFIMIIHVHTVVN